MVIQVLFTIPAPNIWLEAHWTAGDILTYASTVSLGLLALWQNKRVQDENDVAQRKLEDIIYHSNEIGIITKIISHEEQRIETLERAMDTLVNLCDPALLIVICTENESNSMLMAEKLVELEKQVDTAIFEVGRVLRTDKDLCKNDSHPMVKTYGELTGAFKHICEEIKGEILSGNCIMDFERIGALDPIRKNFVIARENYLVDQQKRFERVLFENLSLEEVRKLYKYE